MSLNFKIVEGTTTNDEERYEEWIKEYLNNTPMSEIQDKLGINIYMYRKYRKRALEEGRVVDRRTTQKDDYKYYYRTRHNTFIINKRCPITRKIVHYGTYKTEEQAKRKVEELKRNNWEK